ncbi:phage tail tape measure protein [Bacillus cereus]|uniref:phage tail tape measure protein n=1 Tax=Bacillus cereus TaxID=1396 RepID=UPI00099CE553|nr:phage tail tape measure protein [Bacillus cereus]MDZ4492074.1 phage tail tape measure protein [Bacillus cereus]MEB9974970.1 phage tail tape measure protein [Bacillus cereus]NSL62091.1 phage tail tape measure protein [Bacillus cereus]OPD44022.1 phage tail tape measure protein [Bacillus cereus]
MELFRMFGSIFLRDDELRRGLNQAEQQGQRTTGVLNRGFNRMGQAAGVMGAAVGSSALAIGGMAGIAVGAGAALAGVVSAGAGFEKTMSAVQAVTGASGQDMKKMSELAKKMGSETKFSASQAAEGMQYLGMAGFKTNEIMEAMPGMLSLAAAGQLDLGLAADITSNIMSGFGLKADQATHSADVLAKAASSSNTNVEQMGEAMKYAAGSASTVGFTMEETSAAMMAMANAGLQGSVAGQAWGTSLNRLAKPTKEMKKVMGELNLEFFDSQGKIKPLPQLVSELEKKTAGMTNQQKAATLSTLFGAEAFKNWAALMKVGGEELGRMTDGLVLADGAAKKMADTMSNNLSGKWDEFKSKLEGLGITIFTIIAPALYAILQGAIDAVNGIDMFIQSIIPLDSYIENVERISEALKAMWQAAAGDRNAMVEGYDILTKLGFSANAIQTIQSITEAVRFGIETIKGLVAGDWGSAYNLLEKLGFSPKKIADIQMFVQDVQLQISNFIANIQSLISAAAPVIMGIIGATWDFIKGVFNTIAPYLMPLLTDVMSFVNGIISQITSFWKENGDQIVQAVKNAFDIIKGIIEFVMPVVLFIIEDVWGNIKGVINGALDIILGTIKLFSSLLTGDWTGVWEAIKQILSGAWEFIWNFIQIWGVGKVLGIIGKIGSKMKGLFGEAWEGVKKVFSDMFEGIFKSSGDTLTVIKEVFGKVKDAIATPFKNAWEGVMEWIDKIKKGVSNMFSGVHIPVPKISVNGSLNPVNWASEGLPSFDVKWAANGALIKPGNPTLIGVGDARGYDETVLPLRKQTFDAIANGIMGSLPLNQQQGAKYVSQGPTVLQINLNGREIAKEIYSDVNEFQEREKERLKVF